MEGQALQNAMAANIANFLYTKIIYRHGLFDKLVIDEGLENKERVNQAIKLLSLNKVTTSAYHPQANRMVERSHKPIVDTLTKMKEEGRRNWVSLLPATL